jgi:hypothetical protein
MGGWEKVEGSPVKKGVNNPSQAHRNKSGDFQSHPKEQFKGNDSVNK